MNETNLNQPASNPDNPAVNNFMGDAALPAFDPAAMSGGEGGEAPKKIVDQDEKPITGSPWDIKNIPTYFQYAMDATKLYSIILPKINSKIPAKYRSKIKPGLIIFFLVVYLIIFISLFIGWESIPFVGESISDFLRENDEAMGKVGGLLGFFALLPLLYVAGAVIWRKIRAKNLTAMNEQFTQDMATVLLRPRGDDQATWRTTYANAFWAVIHRIFRSENKDVLLGKIPHASFEIQCYGPWVTKSEMPNLAMLMAMPKPTIGKILTQLRAVHNDMIIEYPKEDLIGLMAKEDEVTYMYHDYAPIAGAAQMLNIRTDGIDNFRVLATVLSEMTTGVYSAGVQLLVRDSYDNMTEISEIAYNMQYSADGKRLPVDKNSKTRAEGLEMKKQYSTSNISYDIVVRCYAIGKEKQEMQNLLGQMEEWVTQISGENNFAVIDRGEDPEVLLKRKFPDKVTLSSVCPAELAGIWHIPDIKDNVTALSRAGFRMLPPPQSAIIQKGEAARTLGFFLTPNGEKLPVGLRTKTKNPDVFYHTYIVGPTGVGKSVLLQNQIVSDMQTVCDDNKPFSVVVLEPHEDLTADILKRVPDDREGDVVLIDPMDHWPIGLNLLETSGRAEEIEGDAMNVISVFRRASGASWDQAVRMQRFMGNSIRTVMRVLPRRNVMPTILHLQAFLSNSAYRNDVIGGLTADDGTLLNEWMSFLTKSENEQVNTFDPAITRVNKFLNNQVIRRVIAQPSMSLDMSPLMDSGSIILAKMHNQMGEENRQLVGAFIVSMVVKAAMSRGRIPDIAMRHPTGLYIDEFQKFVSDSSDEIEVILSEARKMRLSLTMANQYFNQLPAETQNAISNCGTKIIFRTEPKDAQLFGNIFQNKLTQNDFTGLNRYMIHTRMMCNGNPEYATLYCNNYPPLPPDNKVESLNRELVRDVAAKMGITVKEAASPSPVNADEVVGHVFSLADKARNDPAAHAKIVDYLCKISDQQFTDYLKRREEFSAACRKVLLQNKGYIPEKRPRIEELSRLRVGRPNWEVDATINRLSTKIMGVAATQGEDGSADFDNIAMNSAVKPRPSSGKGKKGNYDDLDVMFDTF